MIDLETEKAITLAKAAQDFPGGGKHSSQLYRYATIGRRGCRLETLEVGGVLCTSMPAVHRFIAAVSVAAGCEMGNGGGSGRVSRQKQIAQAEQKLASAGM